MLSRIELPFVSRQVVEARLARWLLAEDDQIEFGDDLCVVDIGEVASLKRNWGRHRRRRAGLSHWIGAQEVDFSVAVTASETGYLCRHLVDPGAPVRVGAPIAVASSTPGETFDPEVVDIAALPSFRTLANDRLEST